MEQSRLLLAKLIDGTCSREEMRRVNMLLCCAAGRALLDTMIEEREAAGLDDAVETDPQMDAVLRGRLAEVERAIGGSRRRFSGRAVMRNAHSPSPQAICKRAFWAPRSA